MLKKHIINNGHYLQTACESVKNWRKELKEVDKDAYKMKTQMRENGCKLPGLEADLSELMEKEEEFYKKSLTMLGMKLDSERKG